MKKLMMITLVVAAMLWLPLSSAFATDVFTTTTEMLMWDPDRAFNGYTIYAPFGNDAIMIDMEGNAINIWPHGDMNTNYAKLLENGNLAIHGGYPDAPSAGGLLTAGGTAGRIQERDWDNNVVFDLAVYDAAGTFRNHHDFQKVWNKKLQQYTWLALVWMVKGAADSAVMGVDDDYISFSANGFSPCGIMEFTTAGELVWQWAFTDHMVTADPSNTGTVDTDGWTDVSGRLNSGIVLLGSGEDFADYPEKLNVNGMHYTTNSGPRPDYQHCNSFDYDDATGYIAINAKAASEFFVIDHDGTFMLNSAADLTGTATTGAAIISVGNTRGADARSSLGDFLYRFGNPSNYDSGRAPGYSDQGDQQMFGTHDIQFIRPYHWRPPMLSTDSWAAPAAADALPGAGDFLMFDNACYDPLLSGSVVLQVNPYIMNAAGDEGADLVDPPTAGYKSGFGAGNDSNQVVWRFGGDGGFGGASPINDFYSSYISGATRMPNGNTVVCSGAFGHLFEVTDTGNVVWEYVIPLLSGGFGQPAVVQTERNQAEANSNFRTYRYGPKFPGLAGHDLTSMGTLTGRIPGSSDQYPAPPPAPTGWGTSGLSVGGGGGGGAGGASTGGGTGAY